jgi:two-component system phosphate regulon response regulator PhoB
LYARLFQKAGFTPIPAEDGSEGLAAIKTRKPLAAVIDYHLPQTSGIELCRQVRQIPECREIKLILFTADDRPKTRQEAIAAEIDNVVLKGPNAEEVIDAVVKLLET